MDRNPSSSSRIMRTVFIIRLAKALGVSKHLCLDPREEMEFCRALFTLFGIKMPLRPSRYDLVRFKQLKPLIQALAIECASILRFHEDADELAVCIMRTSVGNGINNQAIDRAEFLVNSLKADLGLDENYLPVKKAAYNQCALSVFERSRLRYLFADNLEDFSNLPVPRDSGLDYGGMTAASEDFRSTFEKPNIMLAY